MLTLAIAMFCIALLYGVLYLADSHKKHRKMLRRIRGIAALQTGVTLMSTIQQHRGMSSGLLNGNDSFRTGLITKQAEARSIMSHMKALIDASPELARDRRTLENVATGMEAIIGSLKQMTPEQSFSRHTELVRNTIHLIGDMGEHLGLMDNEGTPLAMLSNLLLLRLPLLMESIGQARALGSGYAAKGQVGAVGRIRLSFLESHIRECRENMHIPGNNGSAATEKVEALLDLLEKEFIQADEVNISPEQFFKAATDAIESCLKLWQDVAQHTESAIGTRSISVSTAADHHFREYQRT
ncbi:hypothetical protein A7976_06435 [Methylobacillus sp. MM3]|jgi:hypothetical protein|uniref:nitrate- and nitrite sensing domain-containing protein n=1 Tax=Methylobacillus sp. MM3 TaxID=1848039 RepID=UPI0007E014EA|nr:nitrate- and nitrite sensing domain-containing protein [Methylobacillus sp. MM3]OAJ71073.1 hypothetical protein A7976_06435 [Methylobacillus sp. MM3]